MSRPPSIALGVFDLGDRKVEVSMRADDAHGIARLAVIDPGQALEIGRVSHLHTSCPQLTTSDDYSHRQQHILIHRTATVWREAFDGETI